MYENIKDLTDHELAELFLANAKLQDDKMRSQLVELIKAVRKDQTFKIRSKGIT